MIISSFVFCFKLANLLSTFWCSSVVFSSFCIGFPFTDIISIICSIVFYNQSQFVIGDLPFGLVLLNPTSCLSQFSLSTRRALGSPPCLPLTTVIWICHWLITSFIILSSLIIQPTFLVLISSLYYFSRLIDLIVRKFSMSGLCTKEKSNTQYATIHLFISPKLCCAFMDF